MADYFFVVGDCSLDVNDIELVKGENPSGLVPGYETMKDAIDALITKTNVFIYECVDNELK